LGDDPARDRRLAEVAPWVHAAANPYLDWMIGSPELARAAIERWMLRADSEISLDRTVGLYEDGVVVGGFVALTGEEQARASRSDTLALLATVPRGDRPAMLERAVALADLRLEVAPDQWFLTKLGVLASHRRGGRGRALLQEFLARGRERGLRSFRLDAWAPNEHVVTMYERAGFRSVADAPSAELGGSLLAMVLEE
jgi:ribosomal protein S18 acetylase RimI-like enzyme